MYQGCKTKEIRLDKVIKKHAFKRGVWSRVEDKPFYEEYDKLSGLECSLYEAGRHFASANLALLSNIRKSDLGLYLKELSQNFSNKDIL